MYISDCTRDKRKMPKISFLEVSVEVCDDGEVSEITIMTVHCRVH